jgi:periplasmic copper chaperone A
MLNSAASGVRRRMVALAVTLAAVLGAAGCGGGETPESAPSPTPSAATDAGPITVRDPWVKAADDGMTAAFGTLVNNSDTDLTIVSASTAVSPMELHEMTMKDGATVMQPKTSGIIIKARDSHALEPGGDHLMLLDLSQPVRPGDELILTLTFADGKTMQFTAVAKPFTGAEESYDPGSGMPMSPGPGTHPSTAR